ncbi:ABC transporter substrate-binding protein [Ectobacillus funiculus]|uniref:ABC transporter substrate-binding protein n=1 Tax=Ectobacillus funiculus TaxID=137993 RepID=UPI00101BF018|nr:extracellular solute-binding protein [Ectobacillus funiculus]
MKRSRNIIFSLLLFLGLFLSACSSNSGTSSTSGSKSSADGTTTINFAIHVANPKDQEPAFYQVIKKFEAANPDIKVNLIGKEQQEHVKSIKMASQSDKLPDVFWMLPSSAAELEKADMLMDLTDFIEKNPEIKNSLRKNMLNTYKDSGKLYGLPYQPLVTGLFYNKALFDKYGVKVPETFEDLVEATKVFEKNGITTIAKGAKDDYSVWAFLTMLSRYGYFDKINSILAGRESYDNADFVKYYEKIDELRKVGAFPKNVTTQSYFQAVEQFLSGKAAMLDSGMWDVQKIEKSAIGKDVGFWWGPTFADGVGDQKISSVVPAAPLLVSKKAGEDKAKKEAIYKLLKFYYGTEGTQIMVENQVPPMTNVTVNVDETQHPVFKKLVDQMQLQDWKSQPNQPDLVIPEAIATSIYDSIYGVINGTYTPKQAVKVVEDKISATK